MHNIIVGGKKQANELACDCFDHAIHKPLNIFGFNLKTAAVLNA